MLLNILVVAWLALCSWQDWKQRRVSNWLTVPPVGFAMGLRLAGLAQGDWEKVIAFSALILAGWFAGVIGGADAKATLALAVLNPAIAGWAWAGSVTWYVVVWLITLGRQGPYHLPGMVGFLVGVLGWLLWG